MLGAALVVTAGGILWSLAPMDEWRGPVTPAERIPLSLFVFVFIVAIPFCNFCVGAILGRFEERSGQ
jgi:hypothetical protein